MALRILEYDGAEYRAQLLKGGQKERYLVVTLVLYFGYDRHWSYSTGLRDRLQIPDGFKTYVSEYQINLLEIAYLTDEQLEMFESDFRIVADYFVQKKRRVSSGAQTNPACAGDFAYAQCTDGRQSV